jgi:hypothetical protein
MIPQHCITPNTPYHQDNNRTPRFPFQLGELIMSHEKFMSCIDACNICAAACNYCSSACLKEPDVQSMSACIRLDLDCAEICYLASAYMARGSDNVAAICQLCAGICEACAAECSKHSMDHCRACARACQLCAEECRKMVSAHLHSQQSINAGIAAH